MFFAGIAFYMWIEAGVDKSQPVVTGILIVLAFLAAGITTAFRELYPEDTIESVTTSQFERAAARVESLPEKTQPAWDLARATLQLYFNRNLSQVNGIFWLASVVMAAGFVLISVGVWQAFQHKDSHIPAILAGASGVVTQLIGATFLYIYRSTMQRADEYVRQLERMNTIGMAMQILDTMKDNASDANLKDKTKATLIDLFVRHAHSTALASPSPPPQATPPASG